MPLFGKSSKTPADVVRNLKEALLMLETKGTSVPTGEVAGMLTKTKAGNAQISMNVLRKCRA